MSTLQLVRSNDGSEETDGPGPMSLTRPREPIRKRVALLAVAYAFLVLLHRSSEATSLSLFLDYLGAERLPWTFLAVSLVDVPLALAYMVASRRANRRWLLAGLGAGLVAVMAGARALIQVHLGAGLFVAYLGATSLGTFLVVHWGVLLLDAFTVDESRRAFPLVYAGGHAGSFVAGAAMQLAGVWPARDLLVVVPTAALMGMVVMMLALGRQTEGMAVRQERVVRPGAAAGAQAWKNLGLLTESSLLRAIAAATALMVLLRLCLRYLYGHELESAFAGPEALTRFVGAYTMVASAVGVTLQLFATPWLLRRVGVGRLNLAYAGAVALSLVGLTGAPGLYSATAARFTDLELKGAIKTPLSAMFYDALGPQQRADARAVVLGIVAPTTSLGSSLVLLAFTQSHAPTWWLGWIALGGALAYLLLTALQARAYRHALEDKLVQWARDRQGDDISGVDDAIALARRSDDARMVDVAREVRRRRRG